MIKIGAHDESQKSLFCVLCTTLLPYDYDVLPPKLNLVKGFRQKSNQIYRSYFSLLKAKPRESGISQSNHMDSFQTADEIAFRYYMKLFYVINEARTADTENNLLGTDKWFDLETWKTEMLHDMKIFKSISLAPLPGPPSFEIQVLLSRAGVRANQVFVCIPPEAKSRVFIDPKFTKVLLESWSINFTSREDEILDVSSPAMYRHGVHLFRSIFSYLRILPAWSLYKRLNRRGRDPLHGELAIEIRVRSCFDAEDDPVILYFQTPHSSNSPPLSTNTEIFPSIPHPLGSLSVSVTHLTTANFEVNDVEVYLSSNPTARIPSPRPLPTEKGLPFVRFPPSTNLSKRLSPRDSYSPLHKSSNLSATCATDIELPISNTNLPNTPPSFGFVAPGPRKRNSDLSFSHSAQRTMSPSPLLSSFALSSSSSSSTPAMRQSSAEMSPRIRNPKLLSVSPPSSSAIQIPSRRRSTLVPEDSLESMHRGAIHRRNHKVNPSDWPSVDTVRNSSMTWVYSEGRYGPVQSEIMDLEDARGEKRLVIYSTEDINRLCDIFKELMAHKQQYRALLSYHGDTAQRVIDLIQMLLDDSRVEATFRARLLRLLLRLSRNSGLYPKCFTIKSVTRGESAVTAGQFGEIWKGECQGQKVCLKVVRIYERSHVRKLSKAFSKEAIVWGQISHPNLLPFYGIHHLEELQGRISLVSPWMENGNIREYCLHNEEAPRPLLIQDIISGISYLHHGGIIHGDLKGANILITKSGRACVADFGLSNVVEGDVSWAITMNSSVHTGGTVRWQAPELFDAEDDSLSATKASDIYAFACVCYEVFTGKIPFHEVPREATVIYKIMRGERPPRPSLANLLYVDWGLTDATWSLMEDCWQKDPAARPSAQEALERVGLEVAMHLVDKRPREDGFLHPSQFRNKVLDEESEGMEAGRGEVEEIEALLKGAMI